MNFSMCAASRRGGLESAGGAEPRQALPRAHLQEKFHDPRAYRLRDLIHVTRKRLDGSVG
jgi:hypothetical protein